MFNLIYFNFHKIVTQNSIYLNTLERVLVEGLPGESLTVEHSLHRVDVSRNEITAEHS